MRIGNYGIGWCIFKIGDRRFKIPSDVGRAIEKYVKNHRKLRHVSRDALNFLLEQEDTQSKNWIMRAEKICRNLKRALK